MKNKKIPLIILILILVLQTFIVKAIPTMDEYQYNSKVLIEKQDKKKLTNISSSKNDEVGVIIKDEKIELELLDITKSGETTDAYELNLGNNSGLLTYKNADVDIENANIRTYGVNAFAIYAAKTSKLNINKAEVSTNGKKSIGLYIPGGEVAINSLTLQTTEESSPAIKILNDGKLDIKEGEITTEEELSPLVYVSGNVSLENTSLSSSTSHALEIESGSVVSLKNTQITSRDESSSDNPREYKNIFIKQTENSSKKTTFNAESSEILTESGTPFYITNNNTEINLTNNKIVSASLDVITIEKLDKKADKNKTIINLDNQIIQGNITVDSSSEVKLNMKNKSKMQGALFGDDKSIDLTIDKTSFIILTEDSYLSNLNNEVKNNANIYLNNHSLYVNGEKVTGSDKTPPSLYEDEKKEEVKEEIVEKKIKSSISITVAIIMVVITLTILVTIIVVINIKRNKTNEYY